MVDESHLQNAVRRVVRESLAPVLEELARLAAQVEKLAAAYAVEHPPPEAHASETPRDPGASAPEEPGGESIPRAISAPPPAAATLPKPAPPPARAPTPPAAIAPDFTPPAPATTPAPAPPRTAADPQVALFAQLLRDYPEDAAAVYFAFDRQYRCSPEALDRLAREAGVESAWNGANRASIRFLVERYHGSQAMAAELLGRDTDSLRALVDRLGLHAAVDAVRARERDALRRAPLAQRLAQVLSREKLVRDLGILEELDALTRQEVRDLCAQLSGEWASPAEVFEALARVCDLDGGALDRLVRRYDLQRFVADLYQMPLDAGRPTARRPERSAPRPPLAAEEIERRVLRMLLRKRKLGASHTHIGHLVRTVPPHERGRAREVIDRMLAAGWLVLKTTDNSAEPHVSLAVGALAEIERRVGAAPEALRPQPRAEISGGSR